ncbi:MAG: hypothetical protein MI976_22220 [Pseudomonadales bacterium]|nr:hypothetical protein [Pseudomonadales bacterium]
MFLYTSKGRLGYTAAVEKLSQFVAFAAMGIRYNDFVLQGFRTTSAAQRSRITAA